jgi:hypothetical protein
MRMLRRHYITMLISIGSPFLHTLCFDATGGHDEEGKLHLTGNYAHNPKRDSKWQRIICGILLTRRER